MLTSQINLPGHATPEQWQQFLIHHLGSRDEAGFLHAAITRTVQAAMWHYTVDGFQDPGPDAFGIIYLLQLQQGLGALLGILEKDELTVVSQPKK